MKKLKEGNKQPRKHSSYFRNPTGKVFSHMLCCQPALVTPGLAIPYCLQRITVIINSLRVHVHFITVILLVFSDCCILNSSFVSPSQGAWCSWKLLLIITQSSKLLVILPNLLLSLINKFLKYNVNLNIYDPDAGKVWGQEEKGATEDEMVGWHHQLNQCEFEQTLGDR